MIASERGPGPAGIAKAWIVTRYFVPGSSAAIAQLFAAPTTVHDLLGPVTPLAVARNPLLPGGNGVASSTKIERRLGVAFGAGLERGAGVLHAEIQIRPDSPGAPRSRVAA